MNALEPEKKKNKENQAMAVTPKNLRVFGIGAAIILITIWVLRLFVFHHGNAWILLAIAAYLAITGLVFHPGLKPIYKVWIWIAHKIGWFNTRLLLSIVFYFVITPTGLIMRLFGKDPMARKLQPEAESYWISVKQRPDLSHYEKEF